MADIRSPSILAFDVNETLLDITTLEPLFARIFGDEGVMREWFAQLILYSEAVTLSGLYVPFGALGAGALKMVGETRSRAISDDDVAELRERLGSMPAHEDAAAALSRLGEAGFRLVTVTNSAPSSGPSPLERAGLAGYFERHFSVDAVGRFKPASEVYRMVGQSLGVELSSICLVAAHAWDTLGAQAAGCRSALVTLPGNAILPVARDCRRRTSSLTTSLRSPMRSSRAGARAPVEIAAGDGRRGRSAGVPPYGSSSVSQ